MSTHSQWHICPTCHKRFYGPHFYRYCHACYRQRQQQPRHNIYHAPGEPPTTTPEPLPTTPPIIPHHRLPLPAPTSYRHHHRQRLVPYEQIPDLLQITLLIIIIAALISTFLN